MPVIHAEAFYAYPFQRRKCQQIGLICERGLRENDRFCMLETSGSYQSFFLREVGRVEERGEEGDVDDVYDTTASEIC
jgi:hypothetical protein